MVSAAAPGRGQAEMPPVACRWSGCSRDAHPIEAAERRQILAPGASPGFFGQYDDEPRRGERFLANLSPLRGSVLKRHGTLTTAFGRGYDVSPLRGSIAKRERGSATP